MEVDIGAMADGHVFEQVEMIRGLAMPMTISISLFSQSTELFSTSGYNILPKKFLVLLGRRPMTRKTFCIGIPISRTLTLFMYIIHNVNHRWT